MAKKLSINWINNTAPVVNYIDEALVDYSINEHSDLYAKYTARFENEHKVSAGNDIGGLIVYNNKCVYDYENFCGWKKM